MRKHDATSFYATQETRREIDYLCAKLEENKSKVISRAIMLMYERYHNEEKQKC